MLLFVLGECEIAGRFDKADKNDGACMSIKIQHIDRQWCNNQSISFT